MLKHLALTIGLAVVAILPAAAGVHLLPGVPADHAILAQPDPSLPTWSVPEGVLVVDRRAAADGVPLGGVEFEPRFADGEWFLLERDHAHGHAEPADFGHVHLAGKELWLVEIPARGLDAFVVAGFDLQAIRRTPLTVAAPAVTAEPSPPSRVDPAAKSAYIDALDQGAYNLLLRQISGDQPFLYDGDFQSTPTRFYRSEENAIVAAYLADMLTGYGYTVELDAFTVYGNACQNVVATIPGSVNPDEIVVVGAHFDSTSETAESLAPGAEDNGSGTCLVMELARATAGRQFERTVQFVLFDAEEVGLHGSQHFVDEAVSEGRTIVAAITADMVSYYDRNYGVTIEGQTSWEWLMTAMADNVADHTDIAHDKTYHSWGSDHVPFQQAGIAAFLAIDQDWSSYPYYHRSNDSWDKIEDTVGLALQITRAAAGTLADVAGLMDATTSAPVPVSPTLSLSVHPNPFNPMTTLSFRLDAPASGKLTVHDLHGRVVRTLAVGDFAAGLHTEAWTGVDHQGRAMPSGVYVARLATDQGVTSRKLNLVR